MSKILGYTLSGLGLIGIILSSGKLKESIPFLANLSTPTIIIPSIILVAIGVTLMIFSNKSHSSKQKAEIPIYEGKGKKRRIVGYQRE